MVPYLLTEALRSERGFTGTGQRSPSVDRIEYVVYSAKHGS
jgi:hypothetical protein